MPDKKRIFPQEKSQLHPRNKHRQRYNFKELIASFPQLQSFVQLNKHGDESINFFDPEAVKNLNTALLFHFYNIDFWAIPDEYLCPPIPGRADYIHYMADLLARSNNGIISIGNQIRCLDIGVGANLIYPIIGIVEYNWSFVGCDIDKKAIQSGREIADNNAHINQNLELRLQHRPNDIFRGIIKRDEKFDLTICNPPFHASAEDAEEGSRRKLKNLGQRKKAQHIKNFGGQHSELWTEGGEKRFILDMISQSRRFAHSCLWFSSLVSKQSNLAALIQSLKQTDVKDIETIEMSQGNKTSRILAWTFHHDVDRKLWAKSRWSQEQK